MRLEKTVKIEGIESSVNIYELRVKDIRQIIDIFEEAKLGIWEMIEEILPKCSSLTVDQINDLTPSQIQNLWKEFRVLNGPFFDLLEKMGVAKQVRESILRDLTESFSGLSKEATLMSGATDTPSSEIS